MHSLRDCGVVLITRNWTKHQPADRENVDGEIRTIWLNGEQIPPALILEIQIETAPEGNGGGAHRDDAHGSDDTEEDDHEPLPMEMEPSSDEESDDDHE